MSRPAITPVAKQIKYYAEVIFYCDHIFMDDIIYEVKNKQKYDDDVGDGSYDNEICSYEIEQSALRFKKEYL